MTSLPRSAANPTPQSDLATSARAFGWHLRAANLSPLTVKTYLDAVEQLDRWFRDRGRAPSVDAIERRDVEEFMERWKPATAANRFRGLQRFFGWLAEEGDITANPNRPTRPEPDNLVLTFRST